MTINEYIQQEEHKYYVKQELGYDLVSSTFRDGLSHGLDIGMRFSEWKESNRYYRVDSGAWIASHTLEYYTTAQLLEIYLDTLKPKP